MQIDKLPSSVIKKTWVDKQGEGVYSLALHFFNKDTLFVEYSPECWLIYPYKTDNNKILVCWSTSVDTKYEFDLIKAVSKIDTNCIGEVFMILHQMNDTTLKATYPIERIRNQLNNSNNERIFFPDKFYLDQEGERYN